MAGNKRHYEQLKALLADEKEEINRQDMCAILKMVGFKNQTIRVKAGVKLGIDRANYDEYQHPEDPGNFIAIPKDNMVAWPLLQTIKSTMRTLLDEHSDIVLKLEEKYSKVQEWSDLAKELREAPDPNIKRR